MRYEDEEGDEDAQQDEQQQQQQEPEQEQSNDEFDEDGQESLQSVESEQHDQYYGEIFHRDPSENEIDSGKWGEREWREGEGEGRQRKASLITRLMVTMKLSSMTSVWRSPT